MATPSWLDAIDTAVQELRLERHRSAFTHKLGWIVGALGALPDSPPSDVTAEAMVRLRELVEETINAIEARIDTDSDDHGVQQQLAGTVYEVRRRVEVVELWFRHYTSN